MANAISSSVSSGLCRPVSAVTCPDGADTSQHVHPLEDAQRQPQPQAALHGERTMAAVHACLSCFGGELQYALSKYQRLALKLLYPRVVHFYASW